MSQGGKTSHRSSKRGSSTGRRDSDASRAAPPADDDEARKALAASDKLYYRIGEVSKLTGVKAHVLRYWETEFRWMAPPKSRSKQRLYRKRDIEFVWLLKRLLWNERYTIAGARQRIQDLGVDDALALLDRPAPFEGTSAAGKEASNPSETAPAAATAKGEKKSRVRSEASGDSSPPQADWVSFRAALGEMESELVALRGTLAAGL